MNTNKALWNSVMVTDPAAVKPITGKPYKGNSPKPYWLIERATETFGPIGIGWGMTVKSERFERMTDTDVLHVAVVSVWYILNGVRSETFDQMGGTKAAYQSKNGTVVDEDAGKKSVTDAMVKCLSMIGFCGDIFSGLWDDSKYIEYAYEETARRLESDAPKPTTLTPEKCIEIRALAALKGLDESMLLEWLGNKAKPIKTFKRLEEVPQDALPLIEKAVSKKQKETATA